MKTKITFYDIDEDKVQQAESMGMPIPEPELFESELRFRIEDVIVTYINREGDIALHTIVGTWVIPFDKEVWDKLGSHFND